MVVQYKLLGSPCNPVNRSEISLEINHDQESVINQPKPHVGISNLYFAREDIKKIMDYLSTPPGITEGVPFDIEIKERGATETVNMYLNLMDGFKRSNDGISATVKMLQSLDWLEDRVDGFTFESLYNEPPSSVIIDSILYTSYQKYLDEKCIFIPYVLSTIPQTRDAFTALISVVLIIIQIYTAIKNLMGDSTPVNWLELIFEIIFVIAMLFMLISLIQQLINFLVQPIKYHGAMLVSDMIKVCCHKMGLQFQSSIYGKYPFNSMVYMPEKFEPPTNYKGSWDFMDKFNMGPLNGIKLKGVNMQGYTSPQRAPATAHDSMTQNIQHGYYNGTGGDFMRFAKKICNGKIIIPDQTTDLVLERRDYYPPGTPYQLPDIRQDWNGYNTDELFANMVIRFQTDHSDKNIFDKYLGTIFQATHQQVSVTDKRLVNLKGLRQVDISASRGIRKVGLTHVEEIVKDIITLMNDFWPIGISFINSTVVSANGAIFALNALIVGINGALLILLTIVNTINAIIAVVNALGGNVTPINITPAILIKQFDPINIISKDALPTQEIIGNRDGCLLLETDFVNNPKLLLIDMTRPEFINDRIGYLRTENQDVVNAKYFWDNFYFIDAFVGTPNNRFTKISPATNHDGDRNPFLLSLADFKNLVHNPKMQDSHGEEVIADSIQWYIEKNGSANIDFRKAGWLKNPQSNDGAKRAEEININLQLKTSLPNGQ